MIPAALVAAGAALLSGGNQQFARAAIVIDPNVLRASFDLSAEADGGGTTDDREVRLDAPPGFTSFSVSRRSLNASRSGPNGSASSTAAGSSETTISLTGDLLSVESAASFDTSASFTLAASPDDLDGHGVGSGSFSLSVPIKTTRLYEYSFSGRAVHDIDAGTGIPRSRTRLRFLAQGGGNLLDLDDDHRFGSGTVPVSGSGTLGVGDHSLNLDLDVFAAHTPSGPGRSGAEGSFEFLLTLRPLSRWENPVSGSFQVADNWVGDFVPGEADVAVFDRPGTYTARLDQDVSNHAMRVNGNGVNLTLDLNGNRYTMKDMEVGAGASLVVKGSGGPVASAAMSPQELSPQTLSPQQVRGSIQVDDQLINGTFELVEGAAARAFLVTVDGTMRISDAESVAEIDILDVGTQSARFATLAVVNGGKLVTSEFARLGLAGSGSGVVVSDTGSAWEHRGTDFVIVGVGGGSGSLQVLGGGNFTATDGTVKLGTGSTSEGTLEVAGNLSSFTARTLSVGDSGRGEALVRAGGGISLLNLNVAGSAGAPSTLTVTGAGSALTVLNETSINGAIGGSGTVTIGPGAFALLELANVGSNGKFIHATGTANGLTLDTLAVQAGGQFNVRDGSGGDARDVTVGGAGGAQSLALVEGTGSALRVTEVLSIFTGGTVTARGGGLVQADDTLDLSVGGTLRVELGGMANVGSGVATANRLRVGPGGTFNGGGLIVADGVLRSGGRVNLGNSPGMLTIIGDYEEEAGVGGVLEVEIGGTTPATHYDVLRVEGDASLAGDLLLTFIDGFAPRTGDAFAFLDVTGTMTGSFADVEVRNLLPGFEFDLRSAAGGVTLVALNDGVFVPEPGAAAGMLLLGGATGLLRRRWRVG